MEKNIKKTQRPKKQYKARRKRQRTPGSLRIIPLGGLNEIGKNMFLYEYGNDMIIVDCGIGFPEENMPGIDIVIPDMTYVFKNKHKVRGIFFTHGHEDHIGAVAWLSNEVKAPIYAGRLSIELIKSKMEDRGGSLKGLELLPIEDGDVIKVNSFSVEFIHSNHSIADSNILAIRTPVGLVIHTGDFKVDFTPIKGKPVSLHRLAELGSEKPLLLLCESTNVEKPGFSISEKTVGDSFLRIFEKAPGRVLVAMFSSNVHRMQQIINAALRFNRKISLVGRSVVNVFNAARSLGYIEIPDSSLININQVKNYPESEMVIITTGSQGEPLAALTRMAFDEHRTLDISKNDTVILSSTAIPGNEKAVYRVINELYRRAGNVIYEDLADVHASGHGNREELKLMHQLTSAKYFVPIHGEYRMLYQHSILAQEMGTPEENIFLMNNGDILELGKNRAAIRGKVEASDVLVDGTGYAETDNKVLKERAILADDGVVTISLAIDIEYDELIGEPAISSLGFLYESELDEIMEECMKRIYAHVDKLERKQKSLLDDLATNKLKNSLRNYLYNRTGRRPIIVISVVEV